MPNAHPTVPEPLRPLGPTNLKVSPVALGCWPISGVTTLDVNDRDSLDTINAAVRNQVNFLDTAYCYGPQGESEKLIGQALARPELRRQRDRLVLATKCGIHYNSRGEQVQDARPEVIRRECDASLQRLGLDHVDLYYLHSPDPRTPIEDSAGAIADLIEAGKVRWAGASNCTLEQTKQFHSACSLAAVQLPYNMLQREIERQTIPWCRQEGVAVVVYWALMKGLLAGRLEASTPLAAGDRRRDYPMYQGDEWDKNQQFVAALRDIAEACDKTVAQLVVNWTMTQAGVVSVLCGAKRAWQIEETAGALGWRLTPAQADAVEEAIANRGSAAVNRVFH